MKNSASDCGALFFSSATMRQPYNPRVKLSRWVVGLSYHGSRINGSLNSRKTKKRMTTSSSLSFVQLFSLFCWCFSGSLSGSFSWSLAGWHCRCGCWSFRRRKGGNDVLKFALGSTFFGVLGECNARNEAEHHQDGTQCPRGFFKEIGRLTHAHHLVGTTEIGYQTATF